MNKNKCFNKQMQADSHERQPLDKKKDSNKGQNSLKKKLKKVLAGSQVNSSEKSVSFSGPNRSERPEQTSQMANVRVDGNKKVLSNSETKKVSATTDNCLINDNASNHAKQPISNKQKTNKSLHQGSKGKPLNLDSQDVKSMTATSSLGQEINRNKRKSNSADGVLKKIKMTSGFLETDINDEDQTKAVEIELKKTKHILLAGKKDSDLKIGKSVPSPKPAETKERIIVHGIEHEKVSDVSDSDNDDYIDAFFDESFDKSKSFNENKIYSFEEIKKHITNGFLLDESETDDETSNDNLKENGSVKKDSKKNEEADSPNTKMIPYNKQNRCESSEYDDSDAENYNLYYDSDSFDENASNNDADENDSIEYEESYDDEQEYIDEEEFNSSEEDDLEYDSGSDKEAEEFETDTDEENSSQNSSTYDENVYDESNDSDYASKLHFIFKF